MNIDYKLPLKTLISLENHILYEIPPGKPDPQQKCFISEDKRKRVLQTAQKSATCPYTFNFLRFRIGKFPCEGLEFLRAKEWLCSYRRKRITEFEEKSFPFPISEFYEESVISTLKKMDREKAEQILNDKKVSSIFDLMSNLDVGVSVIPFIKEFLETKNFQNFYGYLIDKRSRKMIKINTEFLSSLKIKCGVDVQADKLFEHEKWKTLSIVNQSVYLGIFVHEVHSNLYDLKKSSWRPIQGIDRLIEELKDKGPLMISGFFGRCYYVDPPFKLKDQDGGRDIYAWKPRAKRREHTGCHSVLIVGAKKIQDCALVYFIDPMDPSDPEQPLSQRIYVISIANVNNNSIDITGGKNPNYDYAYHGNFAL